MNNYISNTTLYIKMSETENTDSEKKEAKEAKPEEKKELTNIEKYNAARKVELEKVKVKESKTKDRETKKYLKEAIEARKAHAPKYVLNLIENLDPKSQLEVLKAHDERQPDPNVSSIGVPIGREKDPLEQYMNFNPNKDTIEWNIPASELMDRNKNKKLLGRE
jgi:hypothetical protein